MKKAVIISMALILSQTGYSQLKTGKDEQAQLPYWEWRTKTTSIRFVQRLPDQSRAYFSGRGFNKEDVALIAQHCIFQTVFKNTSSTSNQQVIKYDLNDWEIQFNGKQVKLKTREDWQDIWKTRNSGQAQVIAFNWSLLPTIQEYKPSDFNWGMTTYPLPHGAEFNLKIKWKENGVTQHAVVKDMQCAKDIYIAPSPE